MMEEDVQHAQQQATSKERTKVRENDNIKEDASSLYTDIDSLVDQSLQIYELSSKEGELIKSLSNSISLLLKTFKTSLQLSHSLFRTEYPSLKEAVLNSNNDIILMLSTGQTIIKKFTELSGSQTVNLMRDIVPKLNELTVTAKVEATDNVEVLSHMTKQMSRVVKAYNSSFRASSEGGS